MSNPVFNVIEKQSEQERVYDLSQVMTVNGTLHLTAILGLILVASAAFAWSRYTMGYMDQLAMLSGIGFFGAIISALIVMFTRLIYMVPVYTICEGLLLGGLSAVLEVQYPGVVTQAVAGTFAALFSMLILYRAGLVRATDKFRSVIYISTLSVFVIYLVDFIGHFFGYAIPVINTSSTGGIIFSLIVVAIAALNLIIDFDFVEKGSQNMLPKKYEWYGAFGLMVTIIWLYIEILKLLVKLRGRD